jgi:hypothetical protein
MIELNVLADNVNKLGYPKTIVDKNWIYGVWYCGTSFQKSIYYGQYPKTFVKRIVAMFPNTKILHLCCGRCKIEGAVNVDFHELPEVDIVANVEDLPADLKQKQFDVVLIDPPYSEQDADRYKVPRLVSAQKVMRQAKESLKEGGYLCWLDEKYPMYKRADWKLIGLISIVTGFERRVRVLSIFKNL